MENEYNLNNLSAYQESKHLVLNVYSLLRLFPSYEQYALCDQLRRAVISISSNIAEGMGRFSTKEQIHFIEIAFGSLMEVYAQLDVATELNYISREQFETINKQIHIVASLLSGLRNKRLATNP